jgi:hypothetical protein
MNAFRQIMNDIVNIIVAVSTDRAQPTGPVFVARYGPYQSLSVVPPQQDRLLSTGRSGGFVYQITARSLKRRGNPTLHPHCTRSRVFCARP